MVGQGGDYIHVPADADFGCACRDPEGDFGAVERAQPAQGGDEAAGQGRHPRFRALVRVANA